MPSTASTSSVHVQPPGRNPIHHDPATLIDFRGVAGGRHFTLRPVQPQDAMLLGELVAGLSPQARCNRFFGALNLSPAHLRQMCCVVDRQQRALVVTVQVDGSERVVADARYCVDEAGEGSGAEFALMVDERWRRLGLGHWALQSLKRTAARSGLTWLHGEVRHGNQSMLGLARRCGFTAAPGSDGEPVVKVWHRLDRTAAPATEPSRHLLGWLRRALPGRAQATRG